MASPALAQLGPYSEITSTPLPGSAHSYINDLSESVNPENGALSIRISAPAPKERGLTLPITVYTYDSNGQSVLKPNWAYSGYTNSEYVTDIRFEPPYIKAQPNTVEYDTNTIDTYIGNRFPVNCTVWYNFLYTDASGNRHPLSGLQGTSNSQQVGCQGLGISASATGQQGGDDLYTGVYLGNGAQVAVFDNDGNALAATAGVGMSVQDRNGNAQYASGRAYSFGSWQNSRVGGSYVSASIPGLGGTYTFAQSVGARGSTVAFPFNTTLLSDSSPSCPTSFVATAGGYSGNATLSVPNGQQYAFSLDSTFGLVNHISYPTGAAVDYVWTTNPQSEQSFFIQPSNTPSDSCGYTYDWPAIRSRTVSINGVITQSQDYAYTTTYASGARSGWTQKTTTITTTDLVTPSHPSYKTVYTYTAAVPSNGTPEFDSIATYDTSGTLLSNLTKVLPSFYNNKLQGECTTLGTGGLTSAVFYGYSARGILPTDKAEYDYGVLTSSCQQPSNTTPTRETVTSFHNFGASQPVYGQGAGGYGPGLIFDRPDSVRVYGNGVLSAETDYSYDDYALSAVTPSATGHDEIYYSPASTMPRGNTTSVTRKCFVAGGAACSKDSVTYIHYDETGQPIQVMDPNGNQTQLSYADNYTSDNGSPTGNTNTYLTSLTRPTTNGIAHVQSFQYGFNDGKIRFAMDENAQQTKICYTTGGCSGSTFDPWFRVTGTKTADDGGSTISYNDTAPSPTVTSTIFASPDPDIKSTTTFDGMGRTVGTQLTSAAGGTVYTASSFDGFGRLVTASNPSQCTPGSSCTETTAGVTQYQYDTLGRPTKITYPDSNYKQWSYTGSSVDRYDENNNHWTDSYDGLGHLAKVVEPGPLYTRYGYDALDNLSSVTQSGDTDTVSVPKSAKIVRPPTIHHDVPRNRTFVYDSLSRLVSATNPESGTTSYTYDPNGNLTTRTDARSIVTTYSSQAAPIDALNRVVQKSYSDGTPTVNYQYDTMAPGTAINAVGRLTGETVQVGAAVLFQRLIPSYDSLGRVAIDKRCVPGFCSNLQSVAYVYDKAGNEVTATTADTILSYTYDGSGQMVSAVTDTIDGTFHGVLLAGAQYSPLGAITAANTFEQRSYDSRGRAKSISYTSGLNYAASYDYYPNGNLHDVADSVNGSWTYNYDGLSRLASAVSSNPTVGTQTYSYDHFGNRTAQTGALSNSAVYSTGTNQVDCTNCYDAAGNLLQDVNAAYPHSYSYDAEGRLSGVTDLGYQYIYDGEGARVGVLQNGSLVKGFFRDANKGFYSVFDGSGNETAIEFFGAGRHLFTFSDDAYLPLLDAQGTERSRVGLYNSTIENCTNLPFGDGMNCNGSDPSPLHFTGQERDTESNLDYFGARHYNSAMGRFMQPDPSGLAYADPMNPQSLNLYSYVLNSPLTFTDPKGLYCDYSDHNIPAQSFDPGQFDFDTNSGECTSNGGQFVNDAYTHNGVDDAGRPLNAVSSITTPSSSDPMNADFQFNMSKPSLINLLKQNGFSTTAPDDILRILTLTLLGHPGTNLRDSSAFCSTHISIQGGVGSDGQPTVSGNIHTDEVHPYQQPDASGGLLGGIVAHGVLDLIPDLFQKYNVPFFYSPGSDNCPH